MESTIRHYNDQYSYPFVTREVNQGHFRINEGIVVNVKESNRVGCFYDVRLFEYDLVIKSCKHMQSNAGYAVGNYQPLEQGTPVVVAFNQGVTTDGIILGTLHLEGDYKKYYEEGQLQKPGETDQQALYNQPAGYPSRLTQTRADISIKGGANLLEPYSSPEFFSSVEGIAESQPYPAIVDIKSPYGDVTHYSLGPQLNYTDSNIVNVTGGDFSSNPTKLSRIAQMHSEHSLLLQGVRAVNTGESIDTDSIESFVVVPPTQTSFVAPDAYRAEQHSALAELYMSSAQSSNASSAGRFEEASRLQTALGSELGTTNPPERTVASTYRPLSQNQNFVSPANYGNRQTTDVRGAALSNKPLVVIHETVSSADSALRAFENPNTQASYHAIIRSNGSIEYLVPANKRAFGAGDSSFGTESASLSSTLPPSVNNFAYHISLESPADGRGDSATHSGYTEAQYRSLAYLVGRTGVTDDRITFHSKIDNSGTRSRDPRSFNESEFFSTYMREVSREAQIDLGL